MKITLKNRIFRTIIMIFIFVSISTIAHTQPLQNFTAKEGLDFAFKQGRILLGDSAKLTRMLSSWGDGPDSYNNKGLSRIWSYSFRNKDSSYVMAINKKNDTFIMTYYQQIFYSIGESIPIDLIRYYSDSTFELSKKCCPYIETMFCSQYHLTMYGNHPYWINFYLADTSGYDYFLSTVYIDAFTGECNYETSDVKDKLIEKINDKGISISPNPVTDFIEISVEANGRSLEQSDIRIYNVLGEIQTTPNPTPALSVQFILLC
jgi:hypothetical protein